MFPNQWRPSGYSPRRTVVDTGRPWIGEGTAQFGVFNIRPESQIMEVSVIDQVTQVKSRTLIPASALGMAVSLTCDCTIDIPPVPIQQYYDFIHNNTIKCYFHASII
jgi:hypothetical protein